MDVKYVTTVTSTDSTGKPVEAIPVRAWAAGETDNAGKPVAAVPITISANGAPVRLVASKTAQNSIGQWLDTMPISGQGAYSLPTPILIEGYDGPIGNYTVSQGTGSIDTVNKVQGTGSLRLKGRGASETPQANKTIASMDPNDFGTIAVWFRQNREGARNNSVRYQIGRAGASYQDALTSTVASMPMSYWGAVHVSELTGLLALGTGAFDVKPRLFQNAPYDMDVNIDCAIRQAKGRTKIGFRFDDTHDTIYTMNAPDMQARGLRAFCPIVPSGAVGIGASNHLSIAQMQALETVYGFEMCCDSWDDNPFTSLATADLAASNFSDVRSYLATNNVGANTRDHFVYPNTNAWIIPTATQIAALTSDGTTTVSFSTSVTFVAGQSLEGVGIPDGTVFNSSGTATTAVVSNPVPILAARAARMIDKSGEFYPGKLQAKMRAAGAKLMFGGGGSSLFAGNDFYYRFGIADIEYNIPCMSVGTSTFAQVKAEIDKAVARGTALILLIHRTDGGGGFDTTRIITIQIFDYVASLIAANLCDNLILSELYAYLQNPEALPV